MARIPTHIDLSTVIAESLETGGGYTWTLASRLGRILEAAQEQFGERDKNYTILGVEFCDTGPKIWYPGSSDMIIIQVGTACLGNEMRACYQMAHEAIHLLSPGGGKFSTNLEEGLATHFAQEYMRTHLDADWHSSMISYTSAARAVEVLLQLDDTVIKKLRQTEPRLSKINADQLAQVCPELDSRIAAYLCRPFERDSQQTFEDIMNGQQNFESKLYDSAASGG